MKNVENTVGYENVLMALNNVFGKDNYTFSKLTTYDDDYEDFSIIIELIQERKMFRVSVADTRTEGMMHRGSGGAFGIEVESKEQNFRGEYLEHLEFCLNDDKDIDYLKHEGSVGKNEPAIEKSLQILKNYLNSQEN